jgi:hypothetical protein
LSNFRNEIALSLVQITKNAKNGTVHPFPDQYKKEKIPSLRAAYFAAEQSPENLGIASSGRTPSLQ